MVVVGAGLAGLTAAYRLMQAGVRASVFESRDRVGGRCWTARGFADGQTAEHGGEFIDTRHVHLLGLVEELGLELEDLSAAWVPGSVWPNWIDDEVVLGPDVREQLDPIAAAVEREARRIGVTAPGRAPSIAAISYGTATPAAVELDARSMTEWLDASVPGVVGSPLGALPRRVDVGVVRARDGSALGVHVDGLLRAPVAEAPTSDGTSAAATTWSRTASPGLLPEGSISLGTPLESVRERGDGVLELRFGGVASPVVADLVVLALPFTTLRLADLDDAGFSPERMAAIRGMGMGMDVKLLVQYDARPSTFRVGDRVWSGGMEHTVPHFETWESSAAQPGAPASSPCTRAVGPARAGPRTFRTGRRPRRSPPSTSGTSTTSSPAPSSHFNGTAWLDLWTRDPWTNGAYAAFLPGQYTRLWGYTGLSEGRVHFAGEHTSTYSQGYLNGGVESGQRAAIEVMRALGLEVPPAIAGLPYSPAV